MGHQKDKFTTNERAHRHPTKSPNLSEDAQNVMNDNVADVDPLSSEETEHARNKATEGIRQGRDKSEP